MKGNDEWTLLHIAAEVGYLDITKALVESGAILTTKNISESMPIHIAARGGYKNIVEYLLKNGSSVHDLGTINQIPLHYTAIDNQFIVAEFLIKQGSDVNAKDCNGVTPLHIAATLANIDVIEILLKNGAFYHADDKFRTSDHNTIKLLASTEMLLTAAKNNSCIDVRYYIYAGAIVDAKNTENWAPLHYAAWKGYDEVVNILLENKANPNTVVNKGFTPLHYAAKYSHLNIVKALLTNGAIFNPISERNKTPLDLTKNPDIANILELLSESFDNIINGNCQVIKHLKKIKNASTLKAVMNARSKENKTLLVTAIHNNFPKVEQLKQIFRDDESQQVSLAEASNAQEKHEGASSTYNWF